MKPCFVLARALAVAVASSLVPRVHSTVLKWEVSQNLRRVRSSAMEIVFIVYGVVSVLRQAGVGVSVPTQSAMPTLCIGPETLLVPYQYFSDDEGFGLLLYIFWAHIF